MRTPLSQNALMVADHRGGCVPLSTINTYCRYADVPEMSEADYAAGCEEVKRVGPVEVVRQMNKLPELGPEQWHVSVKGEKGSRSWEISVVHRDNLHGQISYGWFDERKFLVSHNGGPCSCRILDFVWDEQIKIANALCGHLNAGLSIQ